MYSSFSRSRAAAGGQSNEAPGGQSSRMNSAPRSLRRRTRSSYGRVFGAVANQRHDDPLDGVVEVIQPRVVAGRAHRSDDDLSVAGDPRTLVVEVFPGRRRRQVRRSAVVRGASTTADCLTQPKGENV